MCMHEDHNSDRTYHVSRRADKTSMNYDLFSEQYENKIRGDY